MLVLNVVLLDICLYIQALIVSCIFRKLNSTGKEQHHGMFYIMVAWNNRLPGHQLKNSWIVKSHLFLLRPYFFLHIHTLNKGLFWG